MKSAPRPASERCMNILFVVSGIIFFMMQIWPSGEDRHSYIDEFLHMFQIEDLYWILPTYYGIIPAGIIKKNTEN